MTIVASDALKSILQKFPPRCSYAFAYGSGVFSQKDQKPGKMIDLVIVTEEPEKWHEENIDLNSSHYSALKHLGGKSISRIQDQMASGLYYNPYVKVNNSLLKYGVISRKKFEEDLLSWKYLYIAGRLHKPVLDIKVPNDASLKKAIEKNRESAVRTALLRAKSTLTRTDLYLSIAQISYGGDFRMYVGENPDKVRNLVLPLVDQFDQVYLPIIRDLDPLVKIDEQGVLVQQLDPKIRFKHLMNIPLTIQRCLVNRINLDPRVRDVEECLAELSYDPNLSKYLRGSLAEVVFRSSITQTIQGILSAGPVRSIKYGLEKLKKKWGRSNS